MATHEFKALEGGTLSNPYRYVGKDEIVYLTDAEAELYKDSSWLKPRKVADSLPVPPLMPNLVHASSGLSGAQAMSQLTTPAVNPNFAASDAIHQAVADQNAAAQNATITNGDNLPGGIGSVENETPGGEAEQGTGNQAVI